MSNYEYNKKYAKEWDKKNMKNIGVSLRIEQYEKLKNIVILTILQYQLLLNHVLQI